MPLYIKHPQATELARDLAQRTGKTITDAVITALRESLAREAGRPSLHSLGDDLREISRRCAALPDLDTRSPEQILGFDERGDCLR